MQADQLNEANTQLKKKKVRKSTRFECRVGHPSNIQPYPVSVSCSRGALLDVSSDGSGFSAEARQCPQPTEGFG